MLRLIYCSLHLFAKILKKMASNDHFIEDHLNNQQTCCTNSSCCGDSSGPYMRAQPKVGRNSPCPCGSGNKFKKCCGK